MTYNKVEVKPLAPSQSRIKFLPGGTLVRWKSPVLFNTEREVFIVSANKTENIGAVSLYNGAYLTPSAEVEVLPEGEVITLTVGGQQ